MEFKRVETDMERGIFVWEAPVSMKCLDGWLWVTGVVRVVVCTCLKEDFVGISFEKMSASGSPVWGAQEKIRASIDKQAFINEAYAEYGL